jgi:GNAT superfamily N-acetyltransferase
MIRQATQDDAARLTEMGMQFVASTRYHGVFEGSTEHIGRTVEAMLTGPDRVVFVSGSDDKLSGMIALLLFDHPITGHRTASEVVWWVEPGARGTTGVRLLRAAEEWAQESGATQIQMVAPNDAVGDLYTRMGYEPIEVSYYRRL